MDRQFQAAGLDGDPGGEGAGVSGSSGVEGQECRQVWMGKRVSSEKVSQARLGWDTHTWQASLATKGSIISSSLILSDNKKKMLQ